MGKMRKLNNRALCATCKYRCKFGNFGHNGQNACNYLDVVGESRVFVDGKQVVPSGYCDKYVKGAQDRSIAERWQRSSFFMAHHAQTLKGAKKCTDITKEK